MYLLQKCLFYESLQRKREAKCLVILMAHVINTDKHLCLSLHSLSKMKVKNWLEVSKKADVRISKPTGTQTFLKLH